MTFALDSNSRRRLGYRLIDAIDDYFSSLSTRPVQLPAEQRIFTQLTDAIPELPAEDINRALEDLTRELIDKGFHVPSANYFGLMNPTPTYMAVLAEALIAALNPQIATMARSQLASRIEHETVRWIAERCGYGSDAGGTFTSGGAEANFSGIALALAAHFPESVENGIASIGARPVLYASAESHHSIDKSAGLLGIGRSAVHRVPVNDRLHLRVDELEKMIDRDLAAGHRPFCVVATVGTTNSGAVDNLAAIANVCARRMLWLHIDGAYGGALVFSDQHRDIIRGIERADSITVDPHKWLAMPFAAGVIVTRRSELLRQAFEVTTPYMPRDPGATVVDNFKISTQWSRRVNALKLWLTLKVHGRQAYEEHIDRQLRLARQFADWVRQSENYELFVDPDLTIVNFRVKYAGDEQATAAANRKVVDEVTRDGTRWISETTAAGRSVIRMMIISYLTDESNLQGLQDALTTAASNQKSKIENQE
ncbi:MAG: pyridoxal phosphate-dependent decarboxylase family protein [Terriglobales bacterium]